MGLIKRMAACFIFFSLLVLGGCSSCKKDELISKEDAEYFVKNTWLPRMGTGNPKATDEDIKRAANWLLELYTDDIEILDPNSQDMIGQDSFKGKNQVRLYYEAVLKAYPLWRLDVVDIFPTPKGFVLRYEGRDAWPVKKFVGVDIFELRKEGKDWKIAKLIEFYDRVPFPEPPEWKNKKKPVFQNIP